MPNLGRERILGLIIFSLLIHLCWTNSLDASPASAGPPVGRGIWLWKLSQAENGNLTAIINKLTSKSIQWIALKCGQGANVWQDQCNQSVIARFHDAGIRVYGWQYVYGDDPIGEAHIANRILDLGIDGFIVDAESEYAGKGVNAKIYMLSIRLDHPTSFIAYTTYAIISEHRRFPYVVFGRYSDAVMPQAYWKVNGATPERMLAWMDSDWGRWEQIWRDTGHADAIKPIIPIGQAWNVSGNQIARFSSRVHVEGYSAISLWVYQRMSISMWEAYGNSFVSGSPY